MISKTIHDHFKKISQSKIKSLIKPTVVVSPTDTVSSVINKINKKNVYDAFYFDGKNIQATSIRVLLAGKDISDMGINQFLYSVPFLTENDSVQKAADIINNYRLRSVPVLQNKRIIGAVFAADLLKLIASRDNQWIKTNLIMTQNPISISSSQPLSAARKLMISKRIDHLPVIRNNTIKQVLTSYHVLQALNPHENLGRRSLGMNKIRNLESQIGNIGSTRIPQCSPSDNLNGVINAMLKTDTSCCLVILWDTLQGIITYRDILSLLAVKLESEIPLYVVGLPYDQKHVDLITSKFSKTLKRIRNVYSEIQEAKISIKNQRSGSKNKRGGKYDVSVMITTPHYSPFIFKESGWDLSQIFENLSQKMLRRLSKRAKRRFKTSIRKIEAPGLLEPL